MSNNKSGVDIKISNDNVRKANTVVIIGDWFVDENWLMAKTESYSSSATGEKHYISKHDTIDKRIISLCGASEGLAVLKQYLPEYSFRGFGLWNHIDDGIIKCTLCNEWPGHKLITPYVLHPSLKVSAKGSSDCPYNRPDSAGHTTKNSCSYRDINLVNLARPKIKIATNRVVRCYEGYGSGKPNLLYRFDWVLLAKETDINYKKLKEELMDCDISAIVIQDYGKGVINDKLIGKLLEIQQIQEGQSDNKITWYIRSKISNPEWLKKLKKSNIKARLNVVDFRLYEFWHGKRCRGYGPELGRASLEMLGDLTGKDVYKHGDPIPSNKDYQSERAAVLFNDNTAIAIDGINCYNLYNSPGPQQLITLGRTNIFFIALIFQDLSSKFSQLPFEIQCQNALRVAYEWSSQASVCWREELPHFYGDYTKALNYFEKYSPPERQKDLHSKAYIDLWKKWNASSEKLGVIETDPEKPFQMWRGMGTLKDYICVGGPKRDAINDLLEKVDQFNDQKEIKYSFNCLLVSSPGWGKSFLAKSLAGHFNMDYLEFSLSQMSSSNDVIDCFDTICSLQNVSSKRLLIFIDEINCEIEGHSALGLLLSPIWDGSFIRGGKKYRLSPAVWVFASTESTSKLADPEKNKGSDFISRLNGPIIQLDKLATEQYGHSGMISDLLKALRKELASDPDINIKKLYNKYYEELERFKGVFRTDQVYLGISLLNKLWGPISKVQKDILKMLHDMIPINGFRSLEFFISKFRNVQGGKVVCSNIPLIENFQELKRHVMLPPNWVGIGGKKPADATKDNQFISIETEPDISEQPKKSKPSHLRGKVK